MQQQRTTLLQRSERSAQSPMRRSRPTMPLACANYLTRVITESKEHPVTSTAAARPPLAATPTRNSKIRLSSRTDAHRRPSSKRDQGNGLRKQAIGKVSGESQMEPCERRVCTWQCGFRQEARGA